MRVVIECLKVKSFLLPIILLSLLICQTTRDVVLLKNGDIIKGTIIENVFNDYIRIELVGGSILTFQYSEIINITKDSEKKILIDEKNNIVNKRDIEQIVDTNNFQNSLWFKGPILGYTCIPDANNFAVSIDYQNGNSTSYFNRDKKEEHFSDVYYLDNAASPVESFSVIYVSILYSINNNISIQSYFPFIVDQSWEWNPTSNYENWFDENEPDKYGESGLGDISVGMSYLLDFNDYRIDFSSYYKFATGSSFDEKPDNSYNGTGSGQTDIGFELISDIKFSSSMFFSGFGSYEINNEGTYNYLSSNEKYKRKFGNKHSYGCRLTFALIPNLAIAIQLTRLSAGNNFFDGEEMEDSFYNYIKFKPIIGYQFRTNGKIININCEYSDKISGENTRRYKSLIFSSSM